MSGALDLPPELVHQIIVLAAEQSILDSLPWVMSLLLLSQSFHTLLAPHAYRNLRITHNTSNAFLAHPGTVRYLRHVHTLQFFHLTDSSQQRAWADAKEHIAALAPVVKRFRGPRKILAALAKHATFLPTHWRSDPPILAEQLFAPRTDGAPRTISRLSHAYVSFVSPLRVIASKMNNPPSLTHVCLVPHIISTPGLFLNEIAHLRTAPLIQRIVIRLGFLKTARGKASKATDAKLIRAAAAKWQDPRIFLDESTQEYDLDDDEQWFVGEQLWWPGP